MNPKAMNTTVKALWTAALRSGEYSQAKGYLRSDEGYCCLGVLCEVAVKNGVIPKAERIVRAFDSEPTYIYGDDRAHLTLPSEVMEWAGLTEYNPLTDMDSEVGRVSDESHPRKAPLSELNDSMGFDFEKIADVIDAQL